MKAMVYHRYGSPDVLNMEEIEKPNPAGHEVLIKVRAAALNPIDWHFLRGAPWPVRFMTGLFAPKSNVLGMDMAGQVEAVGQSVTRFQPGDEVFGSRLGGFAEYACVPETHVVAKPPGLSYEEAAAVPIAAITALQGLRDRGQIQPDQQVLIYGASGGVGTFAVQLARHFGAEVTAVCSTGNVDMVREIGAHHVVDYTVKDFTDSEQRYDLIFDVVGKRSFADCVRVLTPDGVFVAMNPSPGGFIRSKVTTQRMVLMGMAKITEADLQFLKELLEAGHLVPVIDRSYPFAELPDALRYLETERARGKVVVTLSPS